MSAPRARRVRLCRTLGVVLGAVLVIGLSGPALLRGPILRAVFARVFDSRCGHFSISGGHLGWATTFELALARPFRVTVEGLSIRGPDESPLLLLGRLQVRATVRLFPARIIVQDALLADGQWRLAYEADGRGSFDAFQPIPAQGRLACLAPPAQASIQGGTAVGFRVEHARFSNLDVDLDFPTWAVALSRVRAELSLTSEPAFHFDIREVRAAKGSLRVGPAEATWKTAVPFDLVAIDRVAVVPDVYTDLLLDVAGAHTGGSTLLGRAVFHHIFAGSVADTAPSGVDVVASWRAFGGALAKLQAGWRPPENWVEHLDGDLNVTLHGPFDELAAALDAEGQGTLVRAFVTPEAATLELSSEDVDTTWMAGPPVRWAVGGRLHGSLLARARLAETLAGADAEILDADFELDRGAASAGPQKITVRVAEKQNRPPRDQLSIDLRRVRLRGGELRVEDARLAWAGASVRARASVGLQEGRLQLVFLPPSVLALGGQRAALPPQFVLHWDERVGVVVEPFRLRVPGNGYVQIAGHVSLDEQIDGSVAIRGCRVASLPWLGQKAAAARARGILAGRVALLGRLSAPEARGEFRLSSFELRGQNVGEVAATLDFGVEGGRVEARIGSSLAATARIGWAPRLAVSAEISMHKQALGPWLPPSLAGASISASGRGRVDYLLGQPLVTHASLDLTGPGLDNVTLAVHSRNQAAAARLGGQIDIAAWPALWSPYLASAEGAVSVDLNADYPVANGAASGVLLIVRDVKLRLLHRQGFVHLFAGDSVALDGDTLSSAGLRVATPWFRGRVAGRAGLVAEDVAHAPLAVSVAGTVDLARLPVRLPAGAKLRGQTILSADVHGSLADTSGPTVHGELALAEVSVALPGLPRFVLDGAIQAEGTSIATRGIAVDIERAGRVSAGSSSLPARLEWSSLYPLQVASVDVPFRGDNLTIARPNLPFRIRDLDLEGRLFGKPGALTLSGTALISGGFLQVARVGSRGPHRPWYADLPPGLTIDLRLRAPRNGLRISVPVLPDVTLDFDCRLHATRHAGSLTGHLYGDSTYARAALGLYNWFGGKDVRRCQVD